MRKFWFSILSVFATSLLFSASASAFTLTEPQILDIAGVTATGEKGGNSISVNQYFATNQAYFNLNVADPSGVNTSTNIFRISLDAGRDFNWSRIKGPILFNFTLRYYTSANDTVNVAAEYPGQYGWFLLNKTCKTNMTKAVSPLTYESDFTCTYWGYLDPNTFSGQANMLTLAGRWNFPYGTGIITAPAYINIAFVSPESGGSSGGGYNGLTDSDKTFISDQINRLYSQGMDQLTALGQIEAAIRALSANGSLSSEQLGEIVDEQKKNNELLEQQQQQDQKDRDDMQQSIDQSQSNAESAGQEVSNKTQGLIDAAVSIIQAFTNAEPSDCKVRTDLGNLDLGTIDFCSGKPDALNAVLNVCTGLICAPIAWYWGKHIASDILSIIESFMGYPMGEFD